ncbi:MAG: hypothetical protein IIC71_01005 [Acidobacteria bacterium]|nr:hypothetical protein [Acidobacteriota bacterium]
MHSESIAAPKNDFAQAFYRTRSQSLERGYAAAVEKLGDLWSDSFDLREVV